MKKLLFIASLVLMLGNGCLNQYTYEVCQNGVCEVMKDARFTDYNTCIVNGEKQICGTYTAKQIK